ncbi:Uncharacterized protein dnm_092350 [Desulfonema magnum]|uniref:Uncharacterized protein n=1 Tax=Desulfonema magnum TaxID=45655 RepID=A0A975BXJ6_9BACT|nr:Uncharacterized protein dnm_092350 [Desulfonema magnum]
MFFRSSAPVICPQTNDETQWLSILSSRRVCFYPDVSN